jgi:hypothetical protein
VRSYETAVCHWSYIASIGLLLAQVLSNVISLTFLPRGIFYPVDEDTKCPPKCWHLSTNLLGPMSHKAVFCTATTLRASNNAGVLCVKSPFVCVIRIIIFLTSIGFDTRWQQYSTHLHTNSTQNTENGTYITIKGNNLGSAGCAPSTRVIPQPARSQHASYARDYTK